MTADEYLTILAEVDAELADELRKRYMFLVEFAVQHYKKAPKVVLTIIYGQISLHEAELRTKLECADAEMDARLEWFK